jgi:ABC-type Fe3+-hydroxamate transport system substrate-binding protein
MKAPQRLSKSKATPFFRELPWLLPFFILLLASLALFRPLPELSPSFPSETWTIIDAQGDEVAVPVIPQKVLSVYLRSYLPKTHAPQFLNRMGSPQQKKGFAETIPAWIYPQLLEDWHWQGMPMNLETLLAQDEPGGLYFGSIWFNGDVYDAAHLRRRFGLTAIATSPYPLRMTQEAQASMLEKLGLTADEYYMFGEIRILNAALDQPALGEKIIAAYQQGMKEVQAELRPETIPTAERPRVLGMGAPRDDWSNLYVVSGDNPFLALRGVTARNLRTRGRQQEAERILAMNPDIITSNPEDLYKDPRWRGLDAVRNRRVYGGNYIFSGYVHDIDNLPLSARWQAEIFHPSRMSAQTREKIRAHYRESYGFEMSEEEIDELLRVRENAASQGYERFTQAAEDARQRPLLSQHTAQAETTP